VLQWDKICIGTDGRSSWHQNQGRLLRIIYHPRNQVHPWLADEVLAATGVNAFKLILHTYSDVGTLFREG